MTTTRTRAALLLLFGAFGAATTAQTPEPTDIAQRAQERAQAIAAGTPEPPWGCKALLCLANPDGPMAVPQCVDPIQRLWSELRRGQPFPSCPMSQGANGGVYAQLGRDPYDRCPAGTSELPMGLAAISNSVQSVRSGETMRSARTALSVAASGLTHAATQVYTGIGNGSEVFLNAEFPTMPPKICAGRQTGTTWVASGEEQRQVQVYDRLVVVRPSQTPSFVEVMLDAGDGRGYLAARRVRF